MVLPPPGGGNTGCGDCEGEDIGPQETEYGRAIRCDETNSGPLRGLGATGGGARVPQRWWEQKGIDWKLARERTENAETEGTTTDTAGAETTALAAEATSESDTGSEEGKEGEESLGASGSSGVEWSGAETE